MRASQKSQRDHRRYMRYRDQHGREWGSLIEIATGEPTGVIEPIGEFARIAPLFPPQKFIHTVPGRPYDLAIDYEAWLAELVDAHQAYKQLETQVGISLHGSAYDATKPSLEVRQIIGAPPLAMEPVKAARAGNKWALGLTAAVPSWARAFVAAVRPPAEAFPDAEDEEYADAGEDPEQDEVEIERPRSAKGAAPRASGGKRPGRPARPARPDIEKKGEPATAGAAG